MMKKLMITAAAVILALAVCLTALADTTAEWLYDSVVKLLCYTGNVTLNVKAEFSMDGEWFKTADLTVKQDYNRSERKLLLTSPKADGTQRQNGYTIVSDNNQIFLMEVFTPGVYRAGNAAERDSILRKTVESGQLVQLGYALAGQANLLLGENAVTRAEDGSVSISLEGEAPLLVNAGVNQLFRFAAKRYFGMDYDRINTSNAMSILSYGTLTEGILYAARGVSVRKVGITITPDANGDLQHAEGTVCLDLETAVDGVHQLEISLKADVSDRDTTMVKKFDPAEYGVVPAADSMALIMDEAESEEFGVEAADENEEFMDRLCLDAIEIWRQTGSDMSATTGVGWRIENNRCVVVIDGADGVIRNTWFTPEGQLTGFQAEQNEWLNRDQLYQFGPVADAEQDRKAREFMVEFLQQVKPELAERAGSLKAEWSYNVNGELYAQYTAEAAEPEQDDVTFVVRIEPELRIEYFACVSNG